ncbi:ATP-dependent DNA helicase RecQ [Balneolaceae bacterium ANBcel3]|nr:ATP-dependent DNA helicase RecQ [Balneolaceae bacterium ANBcel3]
MSDELFNKAKQNLKTFWGFDDFRPGQDEVVASVLSGKETLVLFPTGGGKSLCYQVPATVLDGVTLVISPLVALMQDQVHQLHQKGIKAAFINSTISRQEVEQRLINARNGMYTLLYCAPERLNTMLWKNMLPDLNLAMIAIDEAHCISEWGHDFRPVYRRIPELLADVKSNIRWMALTATATPEVRKDIVDALGFEQPNIISRGFNRPNLQWWTNRTEQKKKRLLEIVRRSPGSGLIYAGRRSLCEELSVWLTREGFLCEPYHAGLTAEEREDIQSRWIDNRLPLVAATNAFGMGIDKPDCRYVVHFDLPMSMEAYYQEAGRAGRDGKESYPVLLIKRNDPEMLRKALLDSWPDKKQLSLVYGALCDHWNLAHGSQMEDWQKADVQQLAIRSKLSVRMIRSGIRLLNQSGVLELTQCEEPKLGVHFRISMDKLDRFINAREKPAKKEFVDRLFRLMGPESLKKTEYKSERHIRSRLSLTSKELENGLAVLKKEGLLDYCYVRNEPLCRLTEPRSGSLSITEGEIMKHRSRLLKKLDYMIGYAETKQCRSRYIRIYFGESDVPEFCGTCDNCKKRIQISDARKDYEQLASILREGPMPFDMLRKKTKWNPARIKETLSYMVREEIVTVINDEEPKYTIK